MEDMRECIRLAKAAGIADDKIILDQGLDSERLTR